MNTLTRMVAVAAIGCAVGRAVSSLAVAQSTTEYSPLQQANWPVYQCTLSYKAGPPSSSLTVNAPNASQAEQMAVAAATPTGASCQPKALPQLQR